ncbi:hypothetical protein TIFTF001_039230 [Ficus carica]|uniref:PGG domain-containing protein n=1 Tax=Ficus carica TaxID=3494 RepID=A0AA88E8S1_FICCA|nr:hypothetical protein TIFTF001_039230 [Ficus carica]
MSMIRLLLRFDRHTAYVQNENGFTALHIAAAYHDYDEMLNEILECCVDCCKLVDKRGWNTLHHAVKRNSDKTIKLLLSYSPLRYLLNDKDENGNTPFPLGGFVRRLVYSAVSHLPPWCGSDGIQQRKPKCTRPCFRKSCRKGGVKEGVRVIMIQCNEDSVVDENRKEFDDESDSQVNKGKEASLIVATLIATVTFTAGFTMPGGYISDAGPLQGAAILRKRSAFKAFMISSTIAMLLSCSAVFIHIYIPMQQDKSQMISLFSTAFILTPFAIVAMVVAFITGTYAALADSVPLAIFTCVIGSSFFVLSHLTFRRL